MKFYIIFAASLLQNTNCSLKGYVYVNLSPFAAKLLQKTPISAKIPFCIVKAKKNMDIQSNRYLLLTGAGFTHNFGTPLASDISAISKAETIKRL